jgi:serine protease Do
MNVHGQKVTRRDFNEKIPAPEGFFFKQVVKIDYQSLSHSPSKGVKVSVSRDGSALELKYTLESGPATAPWSGWVDAFITAYMVPKR